VRLDAGPALGFLHPSHRWTAADLRAYHRAKQSGRAEEATLDRLLTKYASMQIEVLYPELTTGG
jgi:hypothetical protein